MSILVLDFETKDPYLSLGLGGGWVYGLVYKKTDAEILGMAVAGDEKPRYITDKKEMLEVARKHSTLVMHNAAYDLGFLLMLGMSMSEIYKKRIFDTKLAARLYDSNLMSYSLDSLSKLYCNTKKISGSLGDALWEADLYPWLKREITAKTKADKEGKPYERTRPSQAKLNSYAIKHMKELQEANLEAVAKYAIADAQATEELMKTFASVGQKNKNVLFKKIDKVVKLCLKLRLRGIRIDINKAREVRQELDMNVTSLKDNLKEIAGEDVNIWSNDEVGKVLQGRIKGLKFTATGKVQIKGDWLDKQEDKFCKILSEVRTIDKINRDFIDKMIELQEYTTGKDAEFGRIHPEFNIFGTKTGRFSCTSPNVQQIPSRDEYLGPLCRSIFVPEEGKQMYSLDYSNQEGRLQIHYAFKTYCKGSDIIVSEFLQNPKLDLHARVAKMAGITRNHAKIINLGLSYGMGLSSLSKQLKCTYDQASALKEKYLEAAPYLRSLSNKCMKSIRSHGYIRTIGGRHVHRDKIGPDGKDFDYRALNKLIQGSAADQLVDAMIACDAAGIDIVMPIHDQFVIQGNTNDARRCKRIMEETTKLEIPNVVDVDIKGGNNWTEAGH